MKSFPADTILGLTFGILLAFGVAVSAFQSPTQAPPAGNVPAPLNTGPSDQTKTGGLLNVFGLWVNQSLGVTGGATFGGALNLQGNKITNVGTPTGAGDVATKGYVDSFAGGGLQKFTSSGTFIVPSGVTLVKVSLVAGGGSGAGGNSTGNFPVSGGADGLAGGPSSFGLFVSATGGSGGKAWGGPGGSGGSPDGNAGSSQTSGTLCFDKGWHGGIGGRGHDGLGSNVGGGGRGGDGGCGGGVPPGQAGGGGGSGGVIMIQTVAVSPGQTISVTVGGGGTAVAGGTDPGIDYGNGGIGQAGRGGIVVVEW